MEKEIKQLKMSIIEQRQELNISPDKYATDMMVNCRPYWMSQELLIELIESIRGFNLKTSIIIANFLIDCWAGVGLHLTGYQNIDDLLRRSYRKILNGAKEAGVKNLMFPKV